MDTNTGKDKLKTWYLNAYDQHGRLHHAQSGKETADRDKVRCGWLEDAKVHRIKQQDVLANGDWRRIVVGNNGSIVVESHSQREVGTGPVQITSPIIPGKLKDNKGLKEFVGVLSSGGLGGRVRPEDLHEALTIHATGFASAPVLASTTGPLSAPNSPQHAPSQRGTTKPFSPIR